jgi:hypothetical protein
MYSPVSHIAVDGAIVMKYRMNTATAARAAALYDGSYSAPLSACVGVATDRVEGVLVRGAVISEFERTIAEEMYNPRNFFTRRTLTGNSGLRTALRIPD